MEKLPENCPNCGAPLTNIMMVPINPKLHGVALLIDRESYDPEKIFPYKVYENRLFPHVEEADEWVFSCGKCYEIIYLITDKFFDFAGPSAFDLGDLKVVEKILEGAVETLPKEQFPAPLIPTVLGKVRAMISVAEGKIPTEE